MTNTSQIWKTVRIQDVVENLDNKRVPVTKSDRKTGQIPYYGATGIVDYVDEYIFDEKLLLIGEDGADWSAYAKSAYIIEGKSWVNNHAHVLRVTGADIHFLNEFLNFSDLRLHVSGTTRGKLNKSDLMNIQIPLPSIQTQQKISNILMVVNNDIEKTDQIIQKTEDLKKGLMNELFLDNKLWNEFHLGEATNFIDYRGKTPKKTETGIPLITAKNVRMGFVDREPKEYIASDNYESWMTRGIPKLGDVLFTTEAPLGNVAQLDIDGKVAFAQRVIIIQPKQDIRPTFLKYLLMSKKMQEKIGSLGTGGTVKGIKAKVLKQITISVPQKNEQDRIVQILSAVDEKIANEKVTLNKLTTMKKSLMSDIFSRKVEVN